MANPFLFGDPQGSNPAHNEPPNPFLMDANAAANPFMMQQQGFYQPNPAPMMANPQMTEVAANPFAAFGGGFNAAPAAVPQTFGAPPAQPPQQQQVPPAQHQQQFQGQFGQYTQVMAESTAQPEVTSSIPQANNNSNPFGDPSTNSPPPPPPPASTQVQPSPQQPSVEPPLPSPPPITKVTKSEHSQIITDQKAKKEENETKPNVDEESLPPPPPPMVDEAAVKLEQVALVEEPEPPTPPPEVVEDKPLQSSPVKEEGFSGIFKSDDVNAATVDKGINLEIASEEPLAAAVSTSDIAKNAAVEAGDEEDDSDEVKSPEPLSTFPADNQQSAAVEEEIPKVPGGLGAALFGTSDEPMEGQAVTEVGAPKPPQLSTGDAIFADLPSVPDYKSTGASLFGASEESAQGTTGATLFEVEAPREARPELGAMSGWDAAFDQKFDTVSRLSALSTKPGDPFDPFGGPKVQGGQVQMTGTAAFGIDEAGFGGDDFSCQKNPKATPLISRKGAKGAENVFLAMADGNDAENENEFDEEGPLYDDDTSQPLMPFPRVNDQCPGWEMYIRHPPKKKMTAQRFWKKIYVRLVMQQGDVPCVQLFDTKDSKDAFQEVPLQPAYSLSDISHQVFDQYSKIFTLKLQYIFYKERAGIRPGQVSKMQKLTGKLGFLAKAVEDADYQGVKEFASDMKKLGVPLEHAPQVSELLKLGSTDYEDLKQFSMAVEEKLFRMDALRDRSLTYKTEEIQLNAVDEVYVEQTKTGHVIKQLCRVRVFFLSFLSGMPDVELGVNDVSRMGLEVVGRHDILPVPTEQWIRYEDIEFHSIVDKKEFEKNDHIIKFRPPDACYLEIMRFRVRPPKARELPMQARCMFIITGQKVEIRADMMIPYPHTKAWGQVPCEDVAMRIPLPECWIYQFRTEKAHISFSSLAAGNIALSSRMGSVKSAHRRAGKVKGLERFLGTMETQAQELMETSSGQAKYEHQHKAIVWRVPRLPKHGQGSYTNHEFVCKLQLTSYDQVPETFEKNFYVEFTQPATTVSNTVLRSVSVSGGSGEPPEKFVKYLARHEYKLEIEFTEKEANTYAVAAKLPTKEPTPPESPQGDPDFPEERANDDSSDSD